MFTGTTAFSKSGDYAVATSNTSQKHGTIDVILCCLLIHRLKLYVEMLVFSGSDNKKEGKTRNATDPAAPLKFRRLYMPVFTLLTDL